jgi:hypothetical protein
LIRTRKKDRGRFANKNIDVAKMPKSFAVNKGQKVVGFEIDRFGEPDKEAAIMKAMTKGTIISDASGNQYIVEDFLKWSTYGTYGYIFGVSASRRFLIFAVRETESKAADIGVGVEALDLETFNQESRKRKAAVKTGQLSEEQYREWLRQQKAIIDGDGTTRT